VPGFVFDGGTRWTQPFGPRVRGGMVGEWLVEDSTDGGDTWWVIGKGLTAREAMRLSVTLRG
jgi:hypothetical protein